MNNELRMLNKRSIRPFTIRYSSFTIPTNPHPSPPPEYRGREKDSRTPMG
jgi:hypothetical protein